MHHPHGGGGRQYQDAAVRHRAACVLRLHASARSAPVPPIRSRRQMRWPAAIPGRRRPPLGRPCATAWRSRACTAAAANAYATADACRVGTDNRRAQVLRSRVGGGGTAPKMRAHQRQWPSRRRGDVSVLGGARRRRRDGADHQWPPRRRAARRTATCPWRRWDDAAGGVAWVWRRRPQALETRHGSRWGRTTPAAMAGADASTALIATNPPVCCGFARQRLCPGGCRQAVENAHSGGGRRVRHSVARHQVGCVLWLCSAAPLPPLHAIITPPPPILTPPPTRVESSATINANRCCGRASAAARRRRPCALVDGSGHHGSAGTPASLAERLGSGGTAPAVHTRRRQWPSRRRGDANVLGSARRRRRDGAGEAHSSAAVAVAAARGRPRPWRRASAAAGRRPWCALVGGSAPRVGGVGTAPVVCTRRRQGPSRRRGDASVIALALRRSAGRRGGGCGMMRVGGRRGGVGGIHVRLQAVHLSV